MSVTKSQIRKLRTVASARFGACDCRRPTGSSPGHVCDYHQWLEAEFDVVSTKALTVGQAARAIDALEGKPVRPSRARTAADTQGRYAVPGRDGMVTQPQADEVARLEAALGWPEPPAGARRAGYTSTQLQKMIARQTGRPANVHVPIHGLNRHQATTLITGLRRLLDHNRQTA